MTITARVERTANILDRLYPKWYEKIDLKLLDMNNPWLCCAGQLDKAYIGTRGGSYSRFARKLYRRMSRAEVAAVTGENGEKVNHRTDIEELLGFETVGKRSWTNEILKRRALAAAKQAVAS